MLLEFYFNLFKFQTNLFRNSRSLISPVKTINESCIARISRLEEVNEMINIIS